MQRYELVLRQIVDNPGQPNDGDFNEVIVVSGKPAACLAVIPSIMEELGGFPNSPAQAMPRPAAVTYTRDDGYLQGDADRAEAEQDAADEAAGKPKRKRRTKAEMDAARAAEAGQSPTSATGDASGAVTPSVAPVSTADSAVEPAQQVMPTENPLGFVVPPASGGLSPEATASPAAAAAAAPYNPFA